MDTYGMPELVVSPISQVRLLEYPMLTPAASIWGRSLRRAYAFSSGYVKPRSPAKPQQPTSSGTMTLDEQRRAKAVIVSASPILRMEQVMWTATGRSVGVNTSLLRRNVYMNSAGS